MINCPYCDIEITMPQIDAHDGCCPECGGFITSMSSFEDEDFDGIFDEETEEIDEFEDDIFDDDDEPLDDDDEY